MSQMDQLIQLLLEKYPHVVRQPVRLSQVSASEVNSKNFFVWSRGASQPLFVLKQEQFSSNSALDERIERLWLHARLCNETSDLVPSLATTVMGDLYVLRNSTIFTLTKFCAGNHFPGTTASARAAATGLARLHRQLKGTTCPPRPIHAMLSHDELADARRQLNQMKTRSRFAMDLNQFVVAQLSNCYDEVLQIQSSGRLSRQTVYWDFHPLNAIFAGEMLTTILDLDSLSTEFHMQAVAFAASRFCHLADPWPFLAAYDSVFGLSTSELQLYPEMVRWEALCRINYLIRVNVLEGKDMWRGELVKHIRCIEKTRRIQADFELDEDAIRRHLQQTVLITTEPHRTRHAA